jgi:type I restriction enzyme R subunit
MPKPTDSLRLNRDAHCQTEIAITRVLPPISRCASCGGRGERKQRVLDRFAELLERYFGLGW